MALRIKTTEKTRRALERGSLKLKSKPLTYRNKVTVWNKYRGKADDWTATPWDQDDTTVQHRRDAPIACPLCGARKHKCMGKYTPYSFTNIRCHECMTDTVCKAWECPCRLRWYKCRLHDYSKGVHGIINVRGMGTKRKHLGAQRGVDKPMPKELVSQPLCRTRTVVPIHRKKRFLRPGTFLALKFPDLVKLPT